MDIKTFRKKLNEVTSESRPYEHVKVIDSLKKVYPHKLRLVSPLMGGDDCFLYVFREKLPSADLVKFDKAITDRPDVFKEIGQKLISNGFLSLHDEKREGDEVVVYLENGDAEHFGKIVGDEFESKWGIGYAWRHGLLEVPLSYGRTLKFSDGKIDIGVLREILKQIDI